MVIQSYIYKYIFINIPCSMGSHGASRSYPDFPNHLIDNHIYTIGLYVLYVLIYVRLIVYVCVCSGICVYVLHVYNI